MTTETEDILWIAAQQDRLVPRELVSFADKNNKTLYELLRMERSDLADIENKILSTFLEQREKIPFAAYQKIYEYMQQDGIDMITFSDPRFPKGLKNLDDKGLPVMLYHQGKRMQFVNCIAIVGTRNCSTHAVEITREVARQLSRTGYVIVTGLARGIDAAAHRGALSVSGKTVGVLPWIHEPYPPEHARLMQETVMNGCMISEHFFQSPKFDRFKFLQRNAVISGISELLIAIESSYSGGTRWQVEKAISQGKTVIAVEPEETNEPAYDGYTKFLKSGAIGASSVEDVIQIVKAKVELEEPSAEDDYEEDELLIGNTRLT